ANPMASSTHSPRSVRATGRSRCGFPPRRAPPTATRESSRMAGRPPRWGAVAFALVVALAGGIVVLVQHFLRDPSSAVDARSAGRATEDPNESAGATARGETPPHPDASVIPTTTVTAVEPRLEWPDEESLRRLERSGRALFGGIVRAPGGTPCEGATVWFDGEVV